jgi:hypothetical protein
MAIFCLHLIAHNFTCNKKEHCSVIFRIPSIIPCLGSIFSDSSDHKIPSLYVAQVFIIFRQAWHYNLSYDRGTQSEPSRLFLLRLYCGNYRSSISRDIRIYSISLMDLGQNVWISYLFRSCRCAKHLVPRDLYKPDREAPLYNTVSSLPFLPIY